MFHFIMIVTLCSRSHFHFIEEEMKGGNEVQRRWIWNHESSQIPSQQPVLGQQDSSRQARVGQSGLLSTMLILGWKWAPCALRSLQSQIFCVLCGLGVTKSGAPSPGRAMAAEG